MRNSANPMKKASQRYREWLFSKLMDTVSDGSYPVCEVGWLSEAVKSIEQIENGEQIEQTLPRPGRSPAVVLQFKPSLTDE